VGLPRTQFGTRLCHRIICENCEKVDYVSIKVANDRSKFCRACAEKILKKYEVGKIVPKNKTQKKCPQCYQDFLAFMELTLKKDEILCPDCFHGFQVWRGQARKNVNKDKTLKFSSNNTVLRKKNYERI
jgi:DNA-directed RNA polymerase subunit RPC12/RpoP